MSVATGDRQRAIALLRAFAEDTVSAEELISRWPPGHGDRLLEDIAAEFRKADAFVAEEHLKRTAQIALQAIQQEWVPEAFHNALEIDVPQSVSVRRSFAVQMALAAAAIVVLAGFLIAVLTNPSNRFYRAIEKGDVAKMKELLVAHPELLDARDGRGETPLHRAVKSGDSALVKSGDSALVELLLARGARVNTRNRSGDTPLDVAIERGYEDIAELLRAHAAQQ